MKKQILFCLFVFFFVILLPTHFSNADGFRSKLKGKILLQVESKGEAWYVNPDDVKAYYLGRPSDAFKIMRELGLGVSNKDFDSWNGKAPIKLSGKILIKVEDSGKAYYVNPADFQMHYLGRPADAFNIMRYLGLGITNKDLENVIALNKAEAIKVQQERDQKRISDIKKMQNVLNFYYSDTETYPAGKNVLLGIGYRCVGNCLSLSFDNGFSNISSDTIYINPIPTDPLATADNKKNTCGRDSKEWCNYTYTKINNDRYRILFYIENAFSKELREGLYCATEISITPIYLVDPPANYGANLDTCGFPDQSITTEEWRTYRSPGLGISFEYPSSIYYVEEDVEKGESGQAVQIRLHQLNGVENNVPSMTITGATPDFSFSGSFSFLPFLAYKINFNRIDSENKVAYVSYIKEMQNPISISDELILSIGKAIVIDDDGKYRSSLAQLHRQSEKVLVDVANSKYQGLFIERRNLQNSLVNMDKALFLKIIQTLKNQ